MYISSFSVRLECWLARQTTLRAEHTQARNKVCLVSTFQLAPRLSCWKDLLSCRCTGSVILCVSVKFSYFIQRRFFSNDSILSSGTSFNGFHDDGKCNKTWKKLRRCRKEFRNQDNYVQNKWFRSLYECDELNRSMHFTKKRNKTNDGCDTYVYVINQSQHNQKSIINYARKYKNRNDRCRLCEIFARRFWVCTP